MKNLVLVRHAKSSWDNPEWSDFDRPLNKRGLRDAPFLADILVKKGFVPDLIISSTAKRAKETVHFFSGALKYDIKRIEFELGIYERGTKFIINKLSNLESQINNVLLVGHNPDITSLATFFSGDFFDNIPTCGMVSIKFNFNEWENITSVNGELVFSEFPRNFFS